MGKNGIWEEIFRSRPWGRYPSEALIRFVAANFYKASSRRDIAILEVGCGPGRNLWYIAKENFSVYGIDGSPSAISLAKVILDDESPGWKGELRAGDIRKLPYQDNEFDAAIDSEAIYCNSWEDARIIYQEMYRVTKKGGKMLSITFSDDCDGNVERDNKRALKDVVKGPLAYGKKARFTSHDDIAEMIYPWTIETVDFQMHSVGGWKEGVKVAEWIITAKK